MSSTITLQLTPKQARAISMAITLGAERVDNAAAARDFAKSELEALALAEEIAARHLPLLGDEHQVHIDILWERFWAQTDTDWHDWFHGEKSACDSDDLDQPKGWPAFRDAGLKELEGVA